MQPWSRMKVSASRSRSSVVIPGRTSAARWARQAPRILPDARILSISSGRLSRKASTLPVTSGHLAVAAVVAKDGENGIGHRLDGGVAVDELDPRSTILVITQHRSGLGLVLEHAAHECLRGVVGAVVHLGAVFDALLQLALGNVEEEH